MHDTDGGVTVVHVVYQDADANKIKNIVKITTANDHLLIDRPVVLWSTKHFCRDVVFAQATGDLINNFFEVPVSRGRAVGNKTHDLFVLLGVQNGKG